MFAADQPEPKGLKEVCQSRRGARQRESRFAEAMCKRNHKILHRIEDQAELNYVKRNTSTKRQEKTSKT